MYDLMKKVLEMLLGTIGGVLEGEVKLLQYLINLHIGVEIQYDENQRIKTYYLIVTSKNGTYKISI